MKRRLKSSVAVAPPSEPAADANALLQVKVWLVGISPTVWRRVLVPGTFTLRELHGVIQVAMADWQFTTPNARVKLKRLYPHIE